MACNPITDFWAKYQEEHPCRCDDDGCTITETGTVIVQLKATTFDEAVTEAKAREDERGPVLGVWTNEVPR